MATTSSVSITVSDGSALNAGGNDVFLADINRDGIVRGVTFFGGTKDDGAVAAAIDASGNVHLTGFTSSPSLPGVAQIENGQTIFVSTFRGSPGACQ